MKIDFIEQLPSEVSAHIIQYLDISTVFMCTTVSRKWRETIINLKVKIKFQCNWKTGEPRVLKRKGLKYSFFLCITFQICFILVSFFLAPTGALGVRMLSVCASVRDIMLKRVPKGIIQGVIQGVI